MSRFYAAAVEAAATATYASTVKHEVKAGVALTKGQAVYVTSANGTNMIVGKASNASEATSSKVMGLIAATLSTNDIDFVITEGLLDGLNTSTANAGDPVWLGTDGNLIYGLLNKPVAPAHLVFIGIVTRAQQNNGEIFVKVQNGFELSEIHDVLLTSPADNSVLAYNSASGLWIDSESFATKAYADAAAAAVVDAAPSTLNTLNELAAALNDDANFATTVTNSLAAKAPLASPTFTGTVTLPEATTLTRPILHNPLETITFTTDAFAGYTFDVKTSSIFYLMGASTGNGVINFRGNSTTTLTSMLPVGKAISVTLAISNTTTGYYPTGITIDGNVQSVKWMSGLAPSTGNANSVDVYSFTMMKYTEGVIVVFGQGTKFA